MPATEPPLLSILIAARNEEHTIADCLRAINLLDYDEARLEVLIGNDQSTDQTGAVASAFLANRPAFRLIDIQSATAGLRGKANVLAQLAGQARGQYLFFTDADTAVPPDWIGQMLAGFVANQPQPVGIVTGVTLPEGKTLFHKLQTVDWLYNLTLTHLLAIMGSPTTAMGNNMAVSRAAYDAVGGYDTLPFSVVEDYALFRAIVRQGYGFRNRFDEHVLARTQPVATWRALLHQRKRWMCGAVDQPVWIVALLYVHYLVGPLLLLLGWFVPALALGLYLTRLLGQALLLSFGMTRLHRTQLWPYALLFEPYQLLLGPLAVGFYWLPTRLEWKGRWYR